jgi:hypothetical protein
VSRYLPPLTLPAEPGCVPITEAQWIRYISPTLTDLRGDLQTVGPWHLPVRYIAPCLTYVWGEHSTIQSVTLYGPRTLLRLRESGYHLEGQLSLCGRTVSGFTSAEMFRLPDGRLLETSVIHARSSAAQAA